MRWTFPLCAKASLVTLRDEVICLRAIETFFYEPGVFVTPRDIPEVTDGANATLQPVA
jgi:hypothetical protein